MTPIHVLLTGEASDWKSLQFQSSVLLTKSSILQNLSESLV